MSLPRQTSLQSKWSNLVPSCQSQIQRRKPVDAFLFLLHLRKHIHTLPCKLKTKRELCVRCWWKDPHASSQGENARDEKMEFSIQIAPRRADLLLEKKNNADWTESRRQTLMKLSTMWLAMEEDSQIKKILFSVTFSASTRPCEDSERNQISEVTAACVKLIQIFPRLCSFSLTSVIQHNDIGLESKALVPSYHLAPRASSLYYYQVPKRTIFQTPHTTRIAVLVLKETESQFQKENIPQVHMRYGSLLQNI